MRSLGEYLQKEREAQGLSLEQISSDTRVSMDMLRAIEEGNVERLPAPVLVKGFLRAYAKRIGLDAEAVTVKYQDFIEEEGARQEALERFHLRVGPERSRKKRIALLGIFSLAAILFCSVWWFNRSTTQPPSPVSKEQNSGSEAVRLASKPESDLKIHQDPPVTGIQQPPDRFHPATIPEPSLGEEICLDIHHSPPGVVCTECKGLKSISVDFSYLFSTGDSVEVKVFGTGKTKLKDISLTTT